MTLSCQGFNEKNDYDRQTPCDQDFLRKFSRDTDPNSLMQWFNRDVARLLKAHKVFDREGIFIGDASYVFVPDNDQYENSARLLFDEDDHLAEASEIEKLSPKAAVRYRWRRCYKLVSLLHTDRSRRFCLRAALRLLPGNAHECPVLYDLLSEFVDAAGDGVVRRLILDRGFLDGEKIAQWKRRGVDILIPLRKNMDLDQDAGGTARVPRGDLPALPGYESRAAGRTSAARGAGPGA